jgi:hypothetical protein
LRAITWQKLRSLGVLLISFAIFIAISGVLNSCSGGGGEQIVPPPETNDESSGATNRPIITSVSPKAASEGQNVTITGFYFGDTAGADSVVTLGGHSFTIVSWSEQVIEATVPTGATSGIVVVTVGTLSSRSGLNAQLFIGTAPPSGEPMIIALSADTGSVGTRLTIFGFNFGASQGESSVTFAGADGSRVAALIVSEDVNGTPRSMWSNTSIQALIPPNSTTGPVMVTVGQSNSNSNFIFIPLPAPPEGGNAPVITALGPENGPAGTTVVISGNNFGYSRGISIVTIGGLPMQVITWTNDEIVAVVPENAVTNLIRVLVGGVAAESPHVFVVEMVPFLTSLQPNVLQVGAPLIINGRHFGQDKGSIRLTPTVSETGQTATTISGNSIASWSDSEVRVTALPELNSDAGVPVEVTLVSGGTPPMQSGNSITVNVFSPVEATLDVDRPAGVANGIPFTFTVGVGGGAAPYQVEFMFGDNTTLDYPSAVTTSASTTHAYGAAGSYTPSVRVKDNNGSRTTVVGDPLLVVATGQPVIYDVKVITLGSTTNTEFVPNTEVGVYFGQYQSNVFNFDETFLPVIPAVGLDFMTYAKRQYALFAAQNIGGTYIGGRPYAYRFGGGSTINIFGYNLTGGLPFGANTLALNYDTNIGTEFDIANGSPNIFAWTDDGIQFKVPITDNKIGGQFGITFDPSTGLEPIKSPIPLVAAPRLWGYTPGTVDMHTTIDINVNDPVPDIVDSSYLGTKAYLFWSFPAEDATTSAPYLYDRNGDGSNDNYLLPGGVAITLLPDQNLITFDLSTISDNGPYAARDPATTGAIGVNPRAGNWKVFLWVGSKASPFAENFANSGIISNELTIINVTT